MRLIIAAISLGAALAADITLVSFTPNSKATHKFNELNDPVMGGQSTGTWTVDTKDGMGVFDGSVVDVPSLKAPGFIKASSHDAPFADASTAINGDLVLTVRTKTPDYAGFRVSFASGSVSPSFACAAGGSLPFSRGCFKAKFSVPAGASFSEVRIPFNMFSDQWSSATGEQTKTCAQDKDVCPTAKKLSKIQAIEVWAEGALGKAHLEIQSISASPASPSLFAAVPSKRPPAKFDTCLAEVQPHLRFNISTLGPEYITAPVDINANEDLASAICCDDRTQVFAEPQFLFQSPNIDLFAHLDQHKPTTFYDSVCGVPLFRAPNNRTFGEFKDDTDEHGWPSFRTAEVFTEHVRTDKKTGFVTSSCGTHLGSYLPDSKGPRWCMDLSCVSGNPK